MKRALPFLLLVAACGGEDTTTKPVQTPHVVPVASASGSPPSDVLGPRPPVDAPKPYTPPVPTVYKRANGLTVWLVERHALPLVSVEIVVRAGSSDDAPGKEGTAWATASMLDEGAGKRGALEIASDVDRLGATLQTGAFADYSFVHLTTLKKNLDAAAAIMGDVVSKPTFPEKEWKRVHDLWTNDLAQRASEPQAVANVVMAKKLFAGGPYDHPVNGTTKSAKKVGLADLKTFYADEWHPDGAICVVVGDVTRADVDKMLDASFAGWAPAKSGSVVGKAAPAFPKGRRWFVVDRPDAPQSVILVAREGVAANDAGAAVLPRVNAALGGSFTSRLNQDLREENHWSYGAGSRFSFNLMEGSFSASAAVDTPHTGVALKAMLKDIETYAKEGPTEDEAEKTKLIARADLVEAFEGVAGAAHRLGRDAGVGLRADHEAKASAELYAATRSDLQKLAARYVDVSNAVVVVVGPRKEIEAQLAKEGLPKPEPTTAEGE